VKSLDETQRKTAVFAVKSPNEILTSNKARVDRSHRRARVRRDDAGQRESFRALLMLYVSRNRGELADQTIAEITAAGFDKICFAWAGGFEPGQGHYYRIQGRRSSSSSTTRRTTRITSTRCGATSRTTSATICSPALRQRSREVTEQGLDGQSVMVGGGGCC